jgi:hypothetical protein
VTVAVSLVAVLVTAVLVVCWRISLQLDEIEERLTNLDRRGTWRPDRPRHAVSGLDEGDYLPQRAD